jgi:hypothetical protein
MDESAQGAALHRAARPRYNPPMNTLSESALALFRLHVERQGRIDVDDANREAYRELERAGLVMNCRPFTGNQLYSLTREGFERKLEQIGCAKEAV